MVTRHLSLSMIVVLLSAEILGCGGGEGEPALVIEDGGSLDLGGVTIGESSLTVLTVKNTGDGGLTLGTIEAANLGAPFARTGGSCSTGMGLVENASCTVEVSFAPLIAGAAVGRIEISFKDGKGKDRSAGLAVTGTGYDCTESPTLQAALDLGASDATARNASEALSGAAAGAALTHADGKNDSYSSAYTSSYKLSYDYWYADAYTCTYNASYVQGRNDYITCVDGTAAGDSRGYAEGVATGQHDGYLGGYDEAYAGSYDIGYWDGYDEAKYSCTRAAKLSAAEASALAPGAARPSVLGPRGVEAVAASDPTQDRANVQACYRRGYDKTYSSSSYYSAYEAAKGANDDYSSGLDDGNALGKADGEYHGKLDGTSAGAAAGESDGWAVGASENYTNCYNVAYGYAYTSGYGTGYNDTAYGYRAGYDDGSVDGHAAGYYQGYADGQRIYCGATAVVNQALGVRSAPALRGSGQPWAKAAPSGEVTGVVDSFAMASVPVIAGTSTAVRRAAIASIRSEVAKALEPRRRHPPSGESEPPGVPVAEDLPSFATGAHGAPVAGPAAGR